RPRRMSPSVITPTMAPFSSATSANPRKVSLIVSIARRTVWPRPMTKLVSVSDSIVTPWSRSLATSHNPVRNLVRTAVRRPDRVGDLQVAELAIQRDQAIPGGKSHGSHAGAGPLGDAAVAGRVDAHTGAVAPTAGLAGQGEVTSLRLQHASYLPQDLRGSCL